VSSYHKHLERQLRRVGARLDDAPDWVAELLEAVSASYDDSDEHRALLERSVEISSSELLQASSEMRAILSVVPDLFLWLDEAGAILSVHAGQSSDLLSPASLLVGKRVQDIPDERVSRAFSEAIEQMRSSRLPVSFEYELDMEGAARAYEARLIPLLADQTLAILRNVTQRKLAEADRLRTSKLDSVGILAGGIAHDFNNILMALFGSMSVLQLENQDRSPLVLELFDEIEQATLRARDLTQQLLTFSKGGAPVKTSASLGDLLRDTTVFALRGSNVSCEFDIADDLPAVEMDVGQMSQVVNNLVINACQAMPDGGTLRISANPWPRAVDVVRVEVRDEGQGIPPDIASKIFDPYFTTKAEGSGLGLATSYAIVKNHGGELSFQSTPGAGTTFRFSLPGVGAVESGAQPAVELRSGAGRVLLMDDDSAIRRIGTRMLERLGFEATVACSGEEAVQLFAAAQREDRPFTAAVMDLTVPGGMGGVDAVAMMRRLDGGIYAVASSGYSDDPVLARHRDYGFDAALAKPYSLNQVSAALDGVAAAASQLARDDR